MQQFKDSLNRSWPVVIDLASATRVLTDTGIDLLDIRKLGENMEQLRCNMLQLGRVAWSICRLDAVKLGLNQEAFEASLNGDTLLAFFDAMAEGVGNFFPSGQRDLFRKMLTQMKTLEAAAIAEAEATLTQSITYGDGPTSSPE